jgi:hypothetical protein
MDNDNSYKGLCLSSGGIKGPNFKIDTLNHIIS